MASIQCAHCKDTHGSVAEVRACAYQTTPFAGVLNGAARRAVAEREATHTFAVGNVVTLSGFSGKFWEVEKVAPGRAPGGGLLLTTISKAESRRVWVSPGDVDQRWDTLQEAADWLMAQTPQTPEAPKERYTARTFTGWDRVNQLRGQIKAHLLREERGRRIGYFAVLTSEDGADKVKFYRVRTGGKNGRWANHLFVDAQASGDFYPVRKPESLVAVLEGILADPEAAGMLYATELGACRACARTLTDEKSRELGIGPECRKKR